jgi:hypothetical protein
MGLPSGRTLRPHPCQDRPRHPPVLLHASHALRERRGVLALPSPALGGQGGRARKKRAHRSPRRRPASPNRAGARDQGRRSEVSRSRRAGSAGPSNLPGTYPDGMAVSTLFPRVSHGLVIRQCQSAQVGSGVLATRRCMRERDLWDSPRFPPDFPISHFVAPRRGKHGFQLIEYGTLRTVAVPLRILTVERRTTRQASRRDRRRRLSIPRGRTF